MSWKCAEISSVVRPFAYNDNTTSSTSPKRRCRFFTIAGLNVPSRSRGTAISTSPTASEITVFGREPLRIFADSRSRPAPFFSYPRCSVISSFNAVSNTLFVNSFNNPPGPVRARRCSRAWATIAAAATCSGDDCRPTFLIFVHELTASDVITHSAHPTGPQPGVSGRKHRSLHSPLSGIMRPCRAKVISDYPHNADERTTPVVASMSARGADEGETHGLSHRQ